jgi:hypothetical protein
LLGKFGDKAITDLAVTFSVPQGESIDKRLRWANGQRDKGFGVFFDFVIDGHLFRTWSGLCRPWQHDVSECGIECDRGSFYIRRISNSEKLDLTLVVERLSVGNYCSGEGNLNIDPRRGMEPVEIPLRDPTPVPKR